LKKSIRKNKQPVHKIKVCKIIKYNDSFLAFLGNLPFIFRDSVQVAVANLDIYLQNPIATDSVFLTAFAVPFAIIYTIAFIKVIHV
ncbi:unnamed protein product, partial [marine sediment metagenome]